MTQGASQISTESTRALQMVGARVEPEVRAELLAYATANDRTLAAEVRRAVRFYLEHVRNGNAA